MMDWQPIDKSAPEGEILLLWLPACIGGMFHADGEHRPAIPMLAKLPLHKWHRKPTHWARVSPPKE